jgi:ATP-dependent Lon protease
MDPQTELTAIDSKKTDAEEIPIPEELPILPLSGVVLFPGMAAPLMVGQKNYIQLVDEAVVQDTLIGVTSNQQPEEDKEPDIATLSRVGTAAKVLKMMQLPTGGVSFLIQGLSRIRIEEYTKQEPYFVARVRKLEEEPSKDSEMEALVSGLRQVFQRMAELVPNFPGLALMTAMNIKDPGKLADFVIANMPVPPADQQDILEELRQRERIRKVMVLVNREIQKLELSKKIQEEIAGEMGEEHRKHILREQLKKIQEELGVKDEKTVEIETLRTRIAEANLPPEAEKTAQKEVDRLSMMNPAAPEYSVSRTYLDWLIEVPWSKSTEDDLDVKKAEGILNEDHYDLEKVKKRILEYLAVRKLKKDMKGPILCFAGPPGVGKTSLGRSIARALGREFVRMSLGGVHDEAEIRGHRRTYVGALPGRVIQGLKKAGSNNPVFILDEVDKVGADFRGDLSSALLEVLDPEQNFSFSDHYLEVPFDLSKVFFITTANQLGTIPAPLRDRMEVLELPGYTQEEKRWIARKYLFPKQVEAHGLRADQLEITDKAIGRVVQDYTREAGVRNLERELASICRAVARRVVEGETEAVRVDAADVSEYLGPVKFFYDMAERITVPGIATGLAWTPTGGDILFIEATRMEGRKQLILTGQLGDVMKESAQAALSYIRANAADLGVEKKFFDTSDIHVHVPAGAIPKDGPSAGVTMVVALSSLLVDRKVRSDVAMTGEITLRGKVLPVGGIKEKVLAAHRAGIRTILLPKLNDKDLQELPEPVRKEMTFVLLDDIGEAVKAALEKPGRAASSKKGAAAKKTINKKSVKKTVKKKAVKKIVKKKTVKKKVKKAKRAG